MVNFISAEVDLSSNDSNDLNDLNEQLQMIIPDNACF